MGKEARINKKLFIKTINDIKKQYKIDSKIAKHLEIAFKKFG